MDCSHNFKWERGVDMVALPTLTWSDMWYLAPELILSIVTVALIILDLLLPKRVNRNLIGWLALGGLITAAGFVVALLVQLNPTGGEQDIYNLIAGSYRVDDFGNVLKLVFLGASALILLSSLGTVRDEDVPIKGEFYYLIIPAALGAMVMASSADLITLYIGLELLSITTYILVAVRKRDKISAEASFKYVITGAAASAFILYGMSFLYGVAGSTNLVFIGQQMDRIITDYEAMLYVSFFLMIAGFAVKLALAPFHAWAPDVYQGAPTAVSAFLAVVAKGAAFAMLYRIIANTAHLTLNSSEEMYNDIMLALSVLAAAAMIIGTAGALRQRNLKRLLALSGVANAGILTVPLVLDITGLHATMFPEFVFYLVAYAWMNIGAFTVLTMVARSTSGNETMSAFAGLYHRAPWTAAAMTVLLCSLAGLPVTGGFFGKLFILFGTVQTKVYWLAAILLVTTIVSYAVYFRIIRQMYMRGGEDDSRVRLTVPAGITIWLSVVATLVLGFLPVPVMRWINEIFSFPIDMMMWK